MQSGRSSYRCCLRRAARQAAADDPRRIGHDGQGEIGDDGIVGSWSGRRLGITAPTRSRLLRFSARHTPAHREFSNTLSNYWAVDVLQACGARVHLAHPLGVKGFRYRRVKNDVRDAPCRRPEPISDLPR